MSIEKEDPIKFWKVVSGDGSSHPYGEALAHKFYAYSELRKLLLSTGDREIIEDSPLDSYWGCGKDGKGGNMLGKLLTRVRTEIREEEDTL